MARAKVVRPPRADAEIYRVLSEAFRAGDIYSFAYENGTWSTWDTWHDYDATERNGHKSCYCVGDCGFGPIDWDRDELAEFLGIGLRPRPTRLTKAQLVAQLQAISHELPPSALALLAAA